jgi:hypothetical protein
MRTLSSTLLASQKKADRLPYVEAKVYDYEAGIKRLSWTRLYTGSEPDNHHGIAFDSQGSLHRIRAASGNKLYYQKITDPGPSSDYSQWTQIATDCYGPCAIAAYGAKVYMFYRHNELNQLYKLYSHDYGVSWQNAQLADYSEVASLAACWWGTGNNVVCLAIKASFPAKLNGIVLNTSDQTTSQHEWYDENHPLLDTYGIGATYNPFWPAIEIVFAGKESDSPYNHFDLFRTKFSDAYHFLALESFLMAPDGENITYIYPDCHLPSPLTGEGQGEGVPDYETNRIIAVEKHVGTTPYQLPITSHLVKGTYWSDSTFTDPKPFLPSPLTREGQGEGASYGLRLQSTTDYWWLSKPDGVWQAPRVARAPLDLTKDIFSLTQRSSSPSTGEGQGEDALVITLDNSKGQYARPQLLSKLNKRSELVLKLGYKTTAGVESVDAGTYWIDSWEYSASLSPGGRGQGEGVSLFTLHCLDGYGLMSRWSSRYQMRWNKDEVNPRTVWQILYQLLARAGICLTNTPTKPQSSAINNFYPDFTMNPGTPGTQALHKLLSFVPDQLVFRGQEAFTKNPLPAEASCYSYKFPSPLRGEGQGEGVIHAILAGRYTDGVTPSRCRALGQAEDGSRIVQDTLDWDLLQLAIDELEQVYDPNLQTAESAQDRADAILRTQQTLQTQGTINIPTNCGQELLDVVEVTDARCGIDQEKYRVQGIRTLYDRRKGQYDQALSLGAP